MWPPVARRGQRFPLHSHQLSLRVLEWRLWCTAASPPPSVDSFNRCHFQKVNIWNPTPRGMRDIDWLVGVSWWYWLACLKTTIGGAVRSSQLLVHTVDQPGEVGHSCGIRLIHSLWVSVCVSIYPLFVDIDWAAVKVFQYQWDREAAAPISVLQFPPLVKYNKYNRGWWNVRNQNLPIFCLNNDQCNKVHLVRDCTVF